MVRQPIITGDTWFNSDPLKPEDLRGKIVLIDFWTYSCVNCIRTLPHIKRWWDKYRDFGFLVIGIHSPEFEFEKDPANVARAIQNLGVTWPVVLDNDHVNWDNFANRYWPSKYLVDPEGNIVYTHFGEGSYRETEQRIQELIHKQGPWLTLPPLEEEAHAHNLVCFKPTPEIYCGYLRGRIANYEGYHYEHVASYEAPAVIGGDTIALDGLFLAKPDYIESKGVGATMFLQFHATEVNLVIESPEQSAEVEVTLNGSALPDNYRGTDLADIATVNVHEPAMYNLVKSDEPVQGIMAVRAKRGSFRAYAFTFSGCAPTKPRNATDELS